MEQELLDIIQGIMEILNMKGEDVTDGECLDMIWNLLTADGYDIATEIP